MATADRLIFACREDTAVLTSLRAWLEEERERIKERAIKELNAEEVLKLQGAAAVLHKLREDISREVQQGIVEAQPPHRRRFNLRTA